MIPGKYVLLCLIYIQKMEAKGTSFCEESFIDRLFLVLEILMRGGGTLWTATQAKKPLVNRVNSQFMYCPVVWNFHNQSLSSEKITIPIFVKHLSS